MNRPVFDMLVLPTREGWDSLEGLQYLFKGLTDRAAQVPDDRAWIRAMDASGIRRGLLCMFSDDDRPWVEMMCETHPERFVPTMVAQASGGVPELRRVADYAQNTGIKTIRLGPWREQKPPTDRSYWPFYAKACELGIPVQINVGIPGPQVPAWVQDPIYVDEVCYEFPELTVIMTHVGYPWTGTVIRNLERWPNCHLQLNSYMPEKWPADIVEYIRRTKARKTMYGTEFPLLSWARTLDQIEQLGFDDETLDNLLFQNAHRVLDIPLDAEVPA